MTTTTTRARTVELAIKATPEEIWHALTDADTTPAYYVGFRAEFDLRPGATYCYTAGGGEVITGTVVDVEVGRTLVTTFEGHWTPEVAALPQSTVTFTLREPAMPLLGVTVLSCRHDGLADDAAAAHLEAGWVLILSGMKTLLETGVPMVGMPV